jgi:hypothetical protein
MSALVLLVVLAGAAGAQTLESDVAADLRVEWERSNGPAGITGYVYNDSTYRIGFVRLRVTTRDPATERPGEMLAWVHGNVAARGRWSFSVRVPRPIEVEAVTIESFKLIAREETPEGP